MAGGGHMSAVNWDNFRLIFGVYFLYQLYRLAVYFFRKPANLKGNFQTILNWEEFNAAVQATKDSPDEVMVIYFMRGTKFSGGCKVVTPQVTETSLEYSDNKFYFLDVDLNRDHMTIVMNLGIKKVPYFVLFKNGLVVNQCEGLGSDKLVRNWLVEHGCTPNPITQKDVADRAVNSQALVAEKEPEAKKDE